MARPRRSTAFPGQARPPYGGSATRIRSLLLLQGHGRAGALPHSVAGTQLAAAGQPSVPRAAAGAGCAWAHVPGTSSCLSTCTPAHRAWYSWSDGSHTPAHTRVRNVAAGYRPHPPHTGPAPAPAFGTAPTRPAHTATPAAARACQRGPQRCCACSASTAPRTRRHNSAGAHARTRAPSVTPGLRGLVSWAGMRRQLEAPTGRPGAQACLGAGEGPLVAQRSRCACVPACVRCWGAAARSIVCRGDQRQRPAAGGGRSRGVLRLGNARHAHCTARTQGGPTPAARQARGVVVKGRARPLVGITRKLPRLLLVPAPHHTAHSPRFTQASRPRARAAPREHMSLLDIAPIVPGLGERGAAREAWIRGPPRRLEASYGAALRPCAAPVPVCVPSRPRPAHLRPHLPLQILSSRTPRATRAPTRPRPTSMCT